MDSSINFFFEFGEIRSLKKKLIRLWIEEVVRRNKLRTGDLNFIFVRDNKLAKLNRKHLKNNTLTDILTFSFQEEIGLISGDVYISAERVRENAVLYKEPLVREYLRVIIHGVLHLIGFNDKTEKEKKIMRLQEEECLSLYKNLEKRSGELFHVKP